MVVLTTWRSDDNGGGLLFLSERSLGAGEGVGWAGCTHATLPCCALLLLWLRSTLQRALKCIWCLRNLQPPDPATLVGRIQTKLREQHSKAQHSSSPRIPTCNITKVANHL